MKITNRTGIVWLSLGACLAGLAVALGAFGVHGLEKAIAGTVEDSSKSIENWETAARYQMYHCIGIILVGMSVAQFGKKFTFTLAGVCFTIGIFLFSGLLYILACTDLKLLGAIVPVGGLAMIVGWVALAIGYWQSASPRQLGSSDG